MTPEQRLLDNLLDMQEAASEAIGFIRGSTPEAFERDILTQRAVAMTFVLIAAAASRILSRLPDIPSEYPDIAWSTIEGLRNLVLRECRDPDWTLVWDIVQKDLPALVAQLDQLRHPHIQGE